MRWNQSFYQVSPGCPPETPSPRGNSHDPSLLHSGRGRRSLHPGSGRGHRGGHGIQRRARCILHRRLTPLSHQLPWEIPRSRGSFPPKEQKQGLFFLLNPSHPSLTPPSPTGSSRRRPAMPSSGGTCPDSSSHLSGKVRWGGLQETPGVLPPAISHGGIKVVHPFRIRNKGSETLARVAQGGGGFSIPGNIQGQVGWGTEQPGLLGGVSLHGGWMRRPKKVPSNPTHPMIK